MAALPHGTGDPAHLRALAIIPARLESKRLEKKMLLRAGRRALFAHTAHNVLAAGAFARVIVATDSSEIAEEARREGLAAELTDPAHASGSDRAAEVWRRLAAGGETADVIVNVQGDEPEIDPADLLALVRVFGDPIVEAATLASPLLDPAEAALASVVKVVCDRHGDALYFSRAVIPARGHAPHSARGASSDSAPKSVHRRHVGVYAYRPDALLRFCALPRGTLEQHESLEQLRWLEAGRKMRVVPASRAPQGIDTMHDFEQFAARLQGRGTEPRPAPGARPDIHEQSQVLAG
jgi:3-deoxy-manno-octulosonate cytidylyltransferase (CMP-KDO synthetase)